MIAQLQKHVRLWFLTAIALLAAVPPAIARDFTYEYAGQTLTYTVLSEEDKTCETKQGANNYSGNYVRGEVIIPECVFDGADTYTVTTIGENSFYYQTGLTSVKIPNTVITIGSNAFYRCEDLTSIEIPSSVTIIGDKAFTSCTGLTSIEIHNSVTTIGSFAFWNCKALTSIEIPSSVTTIGERAFAECYGLTSIEIPSSVTSIGSSAFQSCTSLSSVIYNCDVTGNNLFLNSPVRDFTFGGAVVPDEMVRLLCINSVEDFTFSSPVTTIGERAFWGCTGLNSIEIPSSVTTIGEWAFARCSNLTSVVYNSDAYEPSLFTDSPVSDLTFGGTTVPENIAYSFGFRGSLKRLTLTDRVTTIGERAFENCAGLTSVELPNSLISIGLRAFYSCTGLTSVAIPNSVTTIGDSAFSNCTGLTSVDLPKSLISIGFRAFDSCIGLTSVEIPNSVTTIGEGAFWECTGLTSIEIPSSVITIGNSVFLSCTNLTSVIYNSNAYGLDLFLDCPVSDLTFGCTTVPDNIAYRFNIRGSLKRLALTDKVITIGDDAFSSCSGLTSIEIPGSVTTIGMAAFSNCSNLTSVVYNSDAYNYSIFSNSPVSDLTLGGTSVPDYMAHTIGVQESLERLTLTDKVKTIGKCAFQFTRLISVELPSSITTIGDNAFDACSGLTSIELPGSVITIGKGAFASCTGLTSIEIPSSVTTIGNSAFESCTGLTSVEIPNSLTTIGSHVFNGCTSLTSVAIPSSVTTIGMVAFGNCTGLTSVELPSSVTTIGDGAFYGCSGLTSIAIPSSVTTIEGQAFEDCTGLTSVIIPGSVATIGKFAFSCCTGLTSIEIPNSVTAIEYNVFSGCSNLTSVIYNSDAYAEGLFHNCQVTDVTFGGTTVPNKVADTLFSYYNKNSLKNITFTDNVSSIGEQAFEGCGNIETISFASVTPPEANQNEFSELWRSARIVVPGDALTTYLDFAPYNRFYKWGTVEEPEGHSDGVFAYVFTENPPAAYIMADESYREAGPALTVPLRTNKGTTIYPIKGILPGAFHYCTNLNSVKIGNNVELIGYNAFASCNALTSVEIPNSVITIGGGAFNGCSGLTSIEIPNSVTTIGDTAFSNCYGLTSLEIPNSVATIGYGAFMGNYKVSELTLGSGLKTIGVAAFQGCARITDVVIPPFVTEIGASAFAGTGLKTVKIGCRVTSIGANAFAQVNDMTGIYVTAMAPPTAENTSFSNYSMPLYVVPGTISLYENASPCWYRFYDEGSISEQTPVTEVTVEDMLLAGAKPGDTFQIKSGVVPAEATLPHLFYVSSNPDVVQVTHEGLVTIMEPQATNDEEIETYSYREPADVEIRVYSMYDDVAPAVIKFDISTGVDDIVIGDASGEIDRSLPYEVYDLNGQMVGTDRSNLANGIYIVRQGSKVQKIAVK